ncbi:MAG: two-component system response regulator [Pseudomonadota bacterium]|nr:two-component system response regulator [Pseudomonadota bacterium]
MRKNKILIVDDEPQFIQTIVNILKQIEHYQLFVAKSGEQAIELFKQHEFDLILLDIIMEPINGYEVCKIIKSKPKTEHLPIIFLTAKDDEHSIAKGFDVGSVDYITKPFFESELLARVHTHISLKLYEDNQQEIIDESIIKLQALNQEILTTQKEVVFTLGSIAEFRSRETGEHVKRVAEYSYLLAKLSGYSDEEAELLRSASPMHDIGKVAIPDHILNKPGKLTPEERIIMETHVELGYEMLKHSPRPIFSMASNLILYHHEKYDGSGYPKGLKGEDIPLCGRITAMADVFDALGSKRPYKEKWPDEEIFNYIKTESGCHFDPKLVDLFFKHINAFLEIRKNLNND